MKNKILTEEIIRIQKIMGAPTNLIMEAAPNIPFAEKGAKELWATIERIFTKEGEELTDQGLKNTIRRLKDVVGEESVEDIEKIMNGGDNLRTKKTNIIDSLSKDEIIQKNILDRIESNNLYKKEIEFFRDKYIREPQIKSFLDDTYIKCLKRKNGDVEEAKELMRRAISSSTVNFPKEALERYLNTSTANKVGLTNWAIKLENVEAPPKAKPPKAKPPKVKPQSLPTTIPIPSELKDSDGVKDFQKWLNDNKPGWFDGKEMTIGGKNYGTFGKKTSKAWEKYESEYLKSTERPSDLKSEEQIKDFQDWMDTKHPNWFVDSEGKVKNLSKEKGWGKYDTNTRKAWETYGEKYKITYGTRQRIKSVDLNRAENPITSKKLSIIEKIFSSDTEIIGGIRRYSLLFLDSWTKVMKGEEVVIDDIFGKFVTVLDKFKAGGTLADSQTYFRDISISLKALQDGKIDIYSTFVKDIEDVLKSSRKYTKEDIAEVIAQLKQENFDAFNPKNTSWLRRLWGESSWNNFRKVLIDKELKWYQKLWEIVKRGAMTLTTGAIKLPSEYAKHFVDKGPGPGFRDAYIIATIITKVTMPIFLATMGTVFAMIKGGIAGKQNESVVEEFKDNLEEQYKSVFTLGGTFSEVTIPSTIISAIVPWHWQWFNFTGWLVDTSNNLINGTIFESWNKQAKKFEAIARQEYNKGVKKGSEAISQATHYKDSIINVQNRKIEDLQNQFNKTQVVTDIDNSEAGFIAWCNKQEPKRIYKPGSYTNGYAQTMDGLDWQWNGKTFEPY